MYWIVVVMLLIASVAQAQENKPPSPQEQILNLQAAVGIYRSDYNKKVQELAEVQAKLFVMSQKVKMLEEAAKPKEESK